MRELDHLSLIQTRVVADRRTLVKDQSYCQKKKKKVELKGRVQQYLHSNRYFPVWKTVRETAHKHFYCQSQDGAALKVIDFLANVCVERQICGRVSY